MCSPYEIAYTDHGITYLISSYEQLKYALTYSEYGCISLDDGINYDSGIYGNLNPYNFKIKRDIDCENATLEINESILYNGFFDGDYNTISRLNIVVKKYDVNNKYYGIFSDNYGIIKGITFKNVNINFEKLEEMNNNGYTIGFITPVNHGEIYSIWFDGCSYTYTKTYKPKKGKSIPKTYTKNLDTSGKLSI